MTRRGDVTKRRRGHGEGTLYRRRGGSWAGAITIGLNANGRQRRKCVYGRTRREVAEKLARLQVARLDGPLAEPGRLRLGEYLNRWHEDVSRPRTRPGTHAEYGRLVRHIVRHVGNVQLGRFGPLHVKGLLEALEREEVGSRTRQSIHRMLHCALHDAQRMGLLRANSCDAVDAPRHTKREIQVLDADQTRRLLEAAAEDERIGALVTVLATTGLRLGEALALRWRDVDFQAGTVQVERTLTAQLTFAEPKTPRSRRRVGLPQRTLTLLRAHRARLRGVPHPNTLVFTDSAGGPWRKSNLIRRHWHPLLRRAEVPHIGFHALRHGHATALLAAGANPRAVAERLGHARASLVLDVYGHALPGADRELTVRADGLYR